MVLCSASSDDCITKDGYFRGVRLCGKVKVVEFGADFMVKVVESFPDVKVKAVDTVAAGDTFNGAFVVALAEGKGVDEAIAFAQAAAARAVTRPGAQSSVPFRREVCS